MTIANWCILIACAMPTATVGLAKISSAKQAPGDGRYSNRQPREWANDLQGWRRRANAAQQNGFEALPLFIAGVLLAQQTHADQARIDLLAMAFISIRVAYVACYLANLATLRTIVWGAGGLACIALFAIS